MAFISTRAFFTTLLLSVLQITFLSPTTAEQYVSSWSSWGECSENCDGEQKRTRKCIHSSGQCGEKLEEKRECSQTTWSTGCFSEEMIIALAVIGVVILVAIIIIVVLYRRNRKEGKRIKERTTDKTMVDAIERRYDNSLTLSTNPSMRHFPSVSSFPDPIKEPEEMELDNFAFDQESLNESIHEMAFTFGTDEEYQPGKAQKKDEEKRMSLKVVSVTETQVIDRDSNALNVKEDIPPVYATVVKPKKDEVVEDVAL